MAEELVNRWAEQSFFDQFKEAQAGFDKLIANIVAINKAGRDAEGLMKLADSLKAMQTSGTQLQQTNTNLKISYRDLANATEFYTVWKDRSNGSTDKEIEGTSKVLRLKIDEEKARRATADAMRAENAVEISRIKLQEEQAKQAARVERSTRNLNDAYSEANREHLALKREAKAVGYELGIESEQFKRLAEAANVYDRRLKEVDAALGDNRRSVGNYSIATEGLRGSISQIARELPALSSGFATFISGISNNYGPAADSVKRFRIEQAKLREEGKPTQSLFSALAGSVLNFQTIILVGITLLAVYGKEVSEFTKNLFRSKEAIDAARAAQDKLNAAYDSPEVKQAVQNVRELRDYIQLAKEDIIDKEKVVKLYNDTIGKTTGEVKDLNQAEIALGENADAYVKMTLYKAAAAAAQQEAVDELLKAERRQLEGERTLANAQKAAADERRRGQKDDGLSEYVQRGIAGSNAADREAADERIKTLDEISKRFRDKAADLAKDNKFDLFGGALDEKVTKQKVDKALENLKDAYEQAAAEFSLKLQNPDIKDADEWLKQFQFALDESNFKVQIDARLKVSNAQLAQDIKDAEGEMNRQLLGVENSYQAGLYSSTQEYENAKLKVIQESADKQSRIRINALRNVLQFLPQSSKEYADIQQQINDAELQQVQRHNAAKLQQERDYQEQRKSLIQQLEQARVDLAFTATDAINGALQSQLQATADKYSKEIDLIKQKTTAEIEGVRESTLSDEEKKRRIAELEQRQTQQVEQEEAKRRQILRISAIAERTAALLRLGIDTAQKLAAIKLQASVLAANPLTAALAPLALAQIPIALGSAAVAAAGILATKLPEYEHGTDFHPGGKARMGEGNKTEMVLEPGKAPAFVHKDGIYDLARGAAVVSNKELMNIAAMYTVGVPQLIPLVQSGQIDITGLREDMRGVKKAIEQKENTSISFNNLGLEFITRKGNSSTRYLGGLTD